MFSFRDRILSSSLSECFMKIEIVCLLYANRNCERVEEMGAESTTNKSLSVKMCFDLEDRKEMEETVKLNLTKKAALF